MTLDPVVRRSANPDPEQEDHGRRPAKHEQVDVEVSLRSRGLFDSHVDALRARDWKRQPAEGDAFRFRTHRSRKTSSATFCLKGGEFVADELRTRCDDGLGGGL